MQQQVPPRDLAAGTRHTGVVEAIDGVEPACEDEAFEHGSAHGGALREVGEPCIRLSGDDLDDLALGDSFDVGE